MLDHDIVTVSDFTRSIASFVNFERAHYAVNSPNQG
jgi:hypothetical protein